jgi:hypothetical protein
VNNQLSTTLLFASIVIVATILGGLSIPLVLGKIGPNAIYGFRTERTLSDPSIWYAANALAGRLSIVCALAMYVLAIAFLLIARHSTMASSQIVWLALGFEVIPPIILAMVLLLYNAQLPSAK